MKVIDHLHDGYSKNLHPFPTFNVSPVQRQKWHRQKQS